MRTGGSGPGELPECLDPGGLMVNALSLIGLGLRNRSGLGHAGACFEKVVVGVVLSTERKANRLSFP